MTMLRVVGAGAAVLMLAVAPAVAQAPDISGRWDVVFNSPQGNVPPAPMELRKDGDKWVGTMYTQQGNADIEVTMKDKVATFHLPPFQAPNGPIQLTMSGTVNGDVMAGTLGADGFQMDWSAKRSAATPAQEPKATQLDLTGTWGLEVVTPAGTGTPTVVLKHEGEKLSGQYSGQLGEAPITGTIKGSDFSFSFTVAVEGNSMTVIYSGTAEGQSMKGTVTLGELGEGTFTGKKK
jgi:hypothetical protein